MAHKIIAADLGTSSIKLARFEATFRSVQLLDVQTFDVGSAGADKPEERIPAQLRYVAERVAEEKYASEEMVIGLPGDVLTFRVIDLPFSNVKQIEQTVGYELESQILAAVEDLVIDFVVVGPARAAGGVTQPETRVLCACAPRVLVEKIVRTAGELGLPLRSVGASPLAYAAFLGSARAEAAAGTGGAEEAAAAEAGAEGEPRPAGARPVLVVDVGCESTTVCAVRDGVPEMARSIARGGRHVTDAIATAFKLEWQRAEDAKHDSGFVAHADTPRLSPSQAHMDAAVREALAPLLRELRQTLAAYRALYGEECERLVLSGGGSRLAGLGEHLGEALGLPWARITMPEREGWADEPAITDHVDVLAVAVGLGAATATTGTQVNFRKGEFAYRSDYSFLRDKARYVAAAVVLILGFAGINAWAGYRGLTREHEVLAAELKKATIEVFGKERDDTSAISDEVKAGPKGIGQLPIPSLTAFDILDEISHVVPPGDKIKLDILELEIKPKKTSIKATTETAQQVDDFTDALGKIECFTEVQKGRLATISVPAPYVPPDQQEKDKDKKDNKPTELKQFTVAIKTTCP